MPTTVHRARIQVPAAGPSAPIVPVETQARLLAIARAALRVAAGIGSPLALAALVKEGRSAELRSSVFVTLTEAGDLRGCIGTLEPEQSIEEAVALTAISAARRDPRFRPLDADELPRIHVDVSVLGEPVELEEPSGFVPGVHGVIVEQGSRRALLLPEVATDHGWDGARMLDAVCEKAGLPRDAWRLHQTRRLVFRTSRFGGPAVEDAAGQ